MASALTKKFRLLVLLLVCPAASQGMDEQQRSLLRCSYLFGRIAAGDKTAFPELARYSQGMTLDEFLKGMPAGPAEHITPEFLLELVNQVPTKNELVAKFVTRILENTPAEWETNPQLAYKLLQWDEINPAMLKFLPEAFTDPSNPYEGSSRFFGLMSAKQQVIAHGDRVGDPMLVHSLHENYRKVVDFLDNPSEGRTRGPIPCIPAQFDLDVLSAWATNRQSNLRESSLEALLAIGADEEIAMNALRSFAKEPPEGLTEPLLKLQRIVRQRLDHLKSRKDKSE